MNRNSSCNMNCPLMVNKIYCINGYENKEYQNKKTKNFNFNSSSFLYFLSFLSSLLNYLISISFFISLLF